MPAALGMSADMRNTSAFSSARSRESGSPEATITLP